MGKSKAKSKTERSHLKECEGSLNPLNSSPESVDKLLVQVNALINNFEYELAKDLCEKALSIDPSNSRVLETLAGVLLDLGLSEDARSILHQCVQIDPEEGHTKFFSLGQLSDGRNAIDYYLKGLQILDVEMQKLALDSEEKKLLMREKSTAYCSLSEIFMTDCCNEKEAEAECNKYIHLGIQADSTNPEIYLSLANFQTVLGNNEEAKVAIEKSLSIWMPEYKKYLAETSVGGDSVQFCLLNYDSRINCSKLCIEASMFKEAAEVLNGLLEEDDEVPDTWYLLGWMNYLQGKSNWNEAHFFFTKMKELTSKIQESNTEQLAHVDELLKEIDEDGEISKNRIE